MTSGRPRGGAPRRGTQQITPLEPPRLRDIRRWDRQDWRRWWVQFAMLHIGLVLFSTALVMNYQSNLGASSWTVFQDGIARHTPMAIGVAGQVIGVIMIILSWVVSRIPPGFGTILNMYLVGLYMDIILDNGWIGLAQSYPARLAMLFGSIALLGIASGIYIKAGFGAGPRDSFNIAVTEVTGLSIGATRWMIEVTVVVLGIILGGRFGVGTIVAAFLIGPAVQIGFRLTGLSARPAPAADGQERARSPIITEADAAQD